MQINLTGHHVDITPSLRSYVTEKLQRLERHFDQVVDAHVVLTVEKLQHKAEARIYLAGGSVYADALEGDMHAAIDALVDKLDRQVKRYKEKLTDHHREDGGLKTREGT